MTSKPRPHVIALRLSELPDLQDLLAPFFAAKGQPRDHVVMARVGDEAVERMDELVEAGLFGSRSEAAAFLIGAGIHSQRGLFERISLQASEIKRLRDELLQTAREALSATAPQFTPPAKPKKPRGRKPGAPEP